MNPLITPEEQRILAEATPKEWADAAKSIATDTGFHRELFETVITGFLEGFFRGLK
jgi:hypothetical protein